jgi:hypothetical protein
LVGLVAVFKITMLTEILELLASMVRRVEEAVAEEFSLMILDNQVAPERVTRLALVAAELVAAYL